MGAGLLFAGGWFIFGPRREEETKTDSKPDAKTTSALTPRRTVITPYGGWGSGGLSIAGEF